MSKTVNRIAEQGPNGAAMMPIIQGVARAAEAISALLRSAVFKDVLGDAGAENIQGEQQQKLDILTDEIFFQEMRSTGFVCAVGSEEQEQLQVVEEYAHADWLVLVDPLDGSSNLDIDGPVGTIFSIVKRSSANRQTPREEDCLQPGEQIAAAGYVLYGPATLLVCSVGNGVAGYSVNPGSSRFELSHPDIRIPSQGGYYSVNEANSSSWGGQMGLRLGRMKLETGLGMRYVGSMVADMHRTLLKGGIFLYPADDKQPQGKLRLLYEAIPMSFLMEQAGGKAMTMDGRVLEIIPQSLHQRVPVFLGSADAVDSLLA